MQLQNSVLVYNLKAFTMCVHAPDKATWDAVHEAKDAARCHRVALKVRVSCTNSPPLTRLGTMVDAVCAVAAAAHDVQQGAHRRNTATFAGAAF